MYNAEKSITTHSAKETHDAGKKYIQTVGADRIFALYGDLGSGKTTFVQGLAKGLGIKRPIISPTFVIIRTYKIAYKNLKFFYHIDLYRTESERDIEGLGIEEIVNDPQNIVAIEWAEKMGRFLPRKRIDIRFAYLSESKRRITVGNLKSQIAKLKTTT